MLSYALHDDRMANLLNSFNIIYQVYTPFIYAGQTASTRYCQGWH